MPTIVGILTFISMMNTTSDKDKLRQILFKFGEYKHINLRELEKENFHLSVF